MKLLKTTSALTLIAAIASNCAYADKRTHIQEVKSGVTFTGATLVGAVAGGPIGMIAGAIGGAYFAEQGKKKVAQQIQLETTAITMNQLEVQVDIQELEIANLEKMIAEKMQFQMYFETGKDQLSEEDSRQIDALADFLTENDYMHVVIDGHADPRGTEEYNNVLSEERAKNVAMQLESSGIPSVRISTKGHGSNFSKGDVKNFDLDRKVKVQVISSSNSANLATID